MFNSKYSQFEHLVNPTDTHNSPATFQSKMNYVSHALVDGFTVLYIDELPVFRKDEDNHYRHL